MKVTITPYDFKNRLLKLKNSKSRIMEIIIHYSNNSKVIYTDLDVLTITPYGFHIKGANIPFTCDRTFQTIESWYDIETGIKIISVEILLNSEREYFSDNYVD